MLEEIKNRMVYGCSSVDSYQLIKQSTRIRNYKVWRVVATICCFYFIGLYISSYSVGSVSSNASLYHVFAIVTFISTILFWTIGRKIGSLTNVLMYVTVSALLLFAVFLGTYQSLTYSAVTIHVLIVAIPMLVVDRPYRLAAIEAFCVIIFCILCAMNKTGSIRELDIFNAIVFGLIGQFIIYYMSNVHMSQFINEEKARNASVTDPLTGLFNRLAFEQELQLLNADANKERMVYLSFDVNSLKLTNDTIGHDAGDELLIGCAVCLRNAFSAYGSVYRIGGDEFSAVIHADEALLDKVLHHFRELTDSWTGNRVKQLSVSIGYVMMHEMPNASMHEILLEADKRMYANKRKFYEASGSDRRKRKDDPS